MQANQINPRPIRSRLIHRRNGWGLLNSDQTQKLLSPVQSFKLVAEMTKPKTIRISSTRGNMSTRSVNSERANKRPNPQVIKPVSFELPKQAALRAQSQRIPERKLIVSKSSTIIQPSCFAPKLSAKAWV